MRVCIYVCMGARMHPACIACCPCHSLSPTCTRPPACSPPSPPPFKRHSGASVRHAFGTCASQRWSRGLEHHGHIRQQQLLRQRTSARRCCASGCSSAQVLRSCVLRSCVSLPVCVSVYVCESCGAVAAANAMAHKLTPYTPTRNTQHAGATRTRPTRHALDWGSAAAIPASHHLARRFSRHLAPGLNPKPERLNGRLCGHLARGLACVRRCLCALATVRFPTCTREC